MSTTKAGHVDARLTDVALQYPQGAFAQSVLFPETPVMKGADNYTTYNKLNLFQTPDDNIGKYSEANELKISTGLATYSVKNRALRGFVSQEDRDNYDSPLDAEVDETEALVSAILNNREVRSQALAATISLKSSPQTKWSAGGTPVKDIETALDAMFIKANRCVISYPVWSVLKHHADLIALYGGGNASNKVLTTEMFGAIFGFEQVFIATARKSTSKAANAAALTYMWGKDMVMAYVAPTGSRKVPTFGRTFAQKLEGGPTFRTRKWRDDAKGIGGTDIIQVEHRSVESIVAADAGYYLYDCIG